jgi:hypothetical protein
MRLLLAALLCTVSALAQDVVVFRGTPSTRLFASVDSEMRIALNADEAKKNECVIVSRKNKYYWASRNDGPMIRIDAPQFTYFVHSGGAGYVKVFTGERSPDSKADYIEGITQGFDVITYWGTAQTRSAAPSK